MLSVTQAYCAVVCIALIPTLVMAAPKRDDSKTMTQIQSQGEGRQKSYFDKNRRAFLLNDAQIMKVMQTLRQNDKEMGELAQNKGDTQAVRSLGDQLEQDQKNGVIGISNVEKNTKVTPQDNDLSQALQTMQKEKSAKLSGLSGKEFDLAYLEQSLALNEKALQVIDTDLLPKAQSPDLKALLVQMKTEMEMHKQRVGYAQSTLNNPGAGSFK